MDIAVGDFAKVVGLQQDTTLNGRHVEIIRALAETTVLEKDGVQRTAPRYGVAFVTAPERMGYMKPENLERVESTYPTESTRRAIWIHETGMEEPAS